MDVGTHNVTTFRVQLLSKTYIYSVFIIRFAAIIRWYDNLVLVNLLELHFESKFASFAQAFRRCLDVTACELNDLLDYWKPKAKTLAVDTSTLLEFTVTSEKSVNILHGDSYASVFNYDLQTWLWNFHKEDFDSNWSLLCELDWVANEIDQDLL